jgi:hypothetical protein
LIRKLVNALRQECCKCSYDSGYLPSSDGEMSNCCLTRKAASIVFCTILVSNLLESLCPSFG